LGPGNQKKRRRKKKWKIKRKFRKRPQQWGRNEVLKNPKSIWRGSKKSRKQTEGKGKKNKP